MTLPLDITPYFSGSTLTYSANGLPAGLALNGSTGLITGNPSTPGVSSVTVTATNPAGSAQQSFQWTITSSASVPSQVTGLVAAPGDGQVSLSWSQPNNNGAAISDYVIERQISGGGFVTLNDGAGTGLSFVDTGLSNGVVHEYRVSAVNSEGTGAASAVASATPASSATVPGQVTGLSATPGDAEVSLSWTAPADGGSPLTDYIIEVNTGSGYSTIADGTGTATSFVHTGLVNGLTHTYRVSAVNAIGSGAVSSTASATPVAAGSAVSIVSRDTGVDGGSAGSYTFPAINIGTGDVIVSTFHRAGSSATAVTLGGAAMTAVASASDGTQGISVWRLDAQSAGTADVAVTLAAQAQRCSVAVWTVANAGAAVAAFDTAPVNDVTTSTVAAAADGVMLAHSSTVNSAEVLPSMTFTNVTPVDLGGGIFVEELTANENVFHGLGDRATTATQSETVTVTHPSTGNLQMLALVAIAPA
ncbi:MAG: fibronectin type III domain-containing protein [Pseudomonadota bacterium]